jgi:hypothetical protein
VLEVLQILEGEINLREETRVAEQARAAVEAKKHMVEAQRLSVAQAGFQDRVVKVVERIRALPDGAADFAKEIALLGQVSTVMKDATKILAGPETGPPAIAAETEAIELLLKSKRINPNGGGGGGSTPGHGGGGDTQDSALAMLGAGLNQKEVHNSPSVKPARSGPRNSARASTNTSAASKAILSNRARHATIIPSVFVTKCLAVSLCTPLGSSVARARGRRRYTLHQRRRGEGQRRAGESGGASAGPSNASRHPTQSRQARRERCERKRDLATREAGKNGANIVSRPANLLSNLLSESAGLQHDVERNHEPQIGPTPVARNQ